jgi:uncharacterized membrane protein
MNILHPPFVHFVIALPIVALFSQFTYMITKDKAYSKAALRIIAFTFLASSLSVISGIGDAQKILENHTIIQEGINLLNNHKIFGFIVVAILLATSLTKWFAISKNSSSLENLSLVLIIISLMVSLYQGRSGGALLYEYSAGIDNRVIVKRVNEQNKNKLETIKYETSTK